MRNERDSVVRKKWRVNDVNMLVRAYLAVSCVICLLMPEGVGLARIVPWTQELPFMQWISGIPGLLPIYADFFALMWLLMPAWIVAFGFVYARNYSSDFVQIPALILVVCIVVAILVLVLTISIDIDGGTWRQQAMVLASRHRLVGAPLFSALMLSIFLLFSIVLAKAPIDFYRRLR